MGKNTILTTYFNPLHVIEKDNYLKFAVVPQNVCNAK